MDKISEEQKTINIAHSQSTNKKADKIIVLRKGKLIEEGTHDSWLADENGVYWALVNAQKLSRGDDFAGESDLIESSTEPLHRGVSVLSGDATAAGVAETWKPKSFF